MRYELSSDRVSIDLVISVLMIVASAAATGMGDEALRAGEATADDRAKSGSAFSVTLIPREEGRTSSGGAYHLAGSARVLIGTTLIFLDGFESGDTSVWSTTIPPVDSMPSGAVVFFEAVDCPSGWSPLSAARGRVVVGLPLAGAPGGVSGASLTDLDHLFHYHSVPSLVWTEAAQPHNHTWAVLDGVTRIWRSHASDSGMVELIDWGDGIDDAGSGIYPFASVPGTIFYTSRVNTHTHSAYLHGTAADHTMPYLQLLACEKN